MSLVNPSEFPFELAAQIASAYGSIAGQLDAQASDGLRAFAAADEDFTGVRAEQIRGRVVELTETQHNLADECRSAAGAMRDLIAEAKLAAQREQAGLPADPTSPSPLHRPPSKSRRAI